MASTEKKALQKMHYAAILTGAAKVKAPVKVEAPVKPGWVRISKNSTSTKSRYLFTMGEPVVNVYLQDAAEREEAYKDKCILAYRLYSQREVQLQDIDRLGDLSPYYQGGGGGGDQDPVALLLQYETHDREEYQGGGKSTYGGGGGGDSRSDED